MIMIEFIGILMRYAFGCIVVDTEQFLLIKRNITLECEPRVFELLVFFCQHPQEAIPRELLVNEVWRGRIVSDAAVNRAVGELRKLIEDIPSKPQWIKTVSKVGYRLAVTPTAMDKQLVDNESPESKTAEIEKTLEVPSESVASEGVTNLSLVKNIAPQSYLKSKHVVVLLVVMLMGIFSYNLINTLKTPDAIEIIERQPATSTMGSAFNPFYSSVNDTLYYLQRSEKAPYAQVYSQKGTDIAQNISQDSSYYTDVITDAEGNIYASRLNNLEARHCEIAIFDSSHHKFVKLIDCGKRVVTQLVTDERKNRLIYRYRASVSEPYAVFSYQLDTGRKEQITHPTQLGNDIGDYVFSLSKDDLTLAIVEYDGNGVDKLKLVDLNNNNTRVNVPFINNVYGLIWRNEHQLLVSNDEGLFVFDTQRFTLEAIEQSDQFGRLIGDTDNEKFFTERGQTTANIYKYVITNKLSEPLTESSAISQTPKLGNRSNVLAFISNRSGQIGIYIEEEGKPVITAKFGEPIEYVTAMSWSPDDDMLIVSMNNGLYLYSVANKTWQNLAVEFSKIHHVAFVGESVMFSAEVDGKWNIWQLSLANQDIKQITTKGGYSVQGNAQRIFYTKFSQPGLYQFDLISQKETLIIQSYPIAGWRHWQLRDEQIYFLQNKKYQVLNLTTNEIKSLHRFNNNMPFSCEIAFSHEFFACEKVEVNTSNIWQFKLSK